MKKQNNAPLSKNMKTVLADEKQSSRRNTEYTSLEKYRLYAR